MFGRSGLFLASANRAGGRVWDFQRVVVPRWVDGYVADHKATLLRGETIPDSAFISSYCRRSLSFSIMYRPNALSSAGATLLNGNAAV